MRPIRLILPILFLSISFCLSAQSDQSEMEKFQKELEETLKKAEKELDDFYREFDSEHRAEIQKKVESALENSKESYAQWEKDFSEIYSDEEKAELKRRIRESSQNLKQHFRGFQDYFNEIGFNEFYYSGDKGERRVVLTRKEVNGKVTYQKTIGGQTASISKQEIEELDNIYQNRGAATGDESGDVISIDRNTSTNTNDGETTKSTTIKIVKKLTGGC